MTALAVCGFLPLAVLIVFGQTVWHDWVNFDDDQYVFANRLVMPGLTVKGVTWAFSQSDLSNWQPLTWLSHMLDCQIFKREPGGHHLTSVLLHAATAIILFLVLRRMTGRLWPSAMVAAIFAVHPLRVESVAWIAERKDVLSGLCFMLTLAAHVHYAAKPAPARYLLVVLAFALGLMAKPMLVTVPPLLLLLDYWPLGRGKEGLGRLVAEKLPLLAMAAAVSIVTLHTNDPFDRYQDLSLGFRAAHAPLACAGYLGQIVWPADLAVPYPLPESLPAWKAVAAVLLLAGILAAAVLLRRRCPYLLVGWLWYLGMLVPVLGLVRVGVQLTADRFTYLPQIGIYIAVVWAIAEIAGPRPAARLIAALAAAGFLAALAVCAWRQTAHWSDSETLWDHTLACTTRNYVAHSNLGVVFAGRGQVDQAIAQYEQALKIKSNYAHAHNNLGLALAGRHQVGKAIDHYHEALAANWDFAEAHNNLGLALAGLGQTDEAITHYREALRINPDYPDVHSNLGLALAGLGQVDQAVAHYRKALEIEPGFVEAHCNLGVALARRGQLDQAVAHWQRALDIKPRCVEAHRNLGDALAGRGHLDQAIAHWQKALEIKPDFTEVHNNLGSVLVGRGQTDSAIAHFEKVLEINPNDAIACNNLACIRATHPDPRFRDGTQAVNLARRAVAATRNDAWALDTLAAAYAEVGRFAEAIETAEQALKVAGNQGKTALADALRARIKLYRAGSPYRVTPPPAQSQRGK